MQTVTISQKEYNKLVESKLKFDYVRQILDADLFSSPPTKNIEQVIEAFKKTGRYNHAFLKSLENGFKRSAYFKNK